MKAIVLMSSIVVFLAISCKSKQVKNDTSAKNDSEQVEDQFFGDENGQSIGPDSGIGAANEPASENTGYASWYGKEMQGKPTASGELYDLNKFTAAHRSLPMGSVVLIKNLENNKKQIVKINDRGPYVDGRIIDVSYAAARDLGFAEKGTARVEIELIQAGKNDFLSKAKIDKEPLDDLNEEELLDEEPEEKSGYTFADGARPAGHTIQIGAFKKRSNAEKFRADIEDQYGRKGFIASKGRWHYVWMGDFRRKKNAKKFQRKLKAEGVDVLFRGKSS